MTDTPTAHPEERLLPQGERREDHRIVLLLVLAAFTVVLLRTAWVCDDAYITFRSIDNFVNGYGLRWNISERVQPFTHPLWLIVMTPFYWLTGEAFVTSIVLSIGITLACLVVLHRRLVATPAGAVLIATTLIFSKAFVDYSTSGLENPLSHLLLILFAASFLDAPASPRRAGLCALLAGLGYLTRPDSILIYLPALICLAVTLRNRRALLWMALGFVPVAVWEVFAILYYGFPFPNPAYAKLVNSATLNRLIHEQGFIYFLHSLNNDPVTLIATFIGLASAFIVRRTRPMLLAIGAILYLVYVFHIGGDFMSGRFFTIPLLVAAILLARLPWSWLPPYAVYVPLTVICLAGSNNLLRPFGQEVYNETGIYDLTSVIDERSYYYPFSGLMRLNRFAEVPYFPTAEEARRLRVETTERRVVYRGDVGYRGYFGGPLIHVVDIYGLSNAFIARLPTNSISYLRPGHILRNFPRDYMRSVEQEENVIRDRKLAECYDKLTLITSGPIWSWERMKAIYSMNFGKHRRWMKRHRIVWMLSDLQERCYDGQFWDYYANVFIGDDGIEIDLEGMRHNTRLDVSFDSNDRYTMFLDNGGEECGQVEIGTAPGEGMVNRRVEVEPECARTGYDRLRIFPRVGDNRFSMGHLILIDDESPDAGADSAGEP